MKSTKIDTQLPRRVQQYLVGHSMIQSHGPLVVGVSGGADSVCLLHILTRLRDAMGVDLHVAHLNHQLRGVESDTDAEFVSHLAHELGAPITIQSCDVESYQTEKRCSLEEAAREVRYAFFANVAHSIGANTVAVGHTVDDQAETVLMHLIRGSGLLGLRGMLPLSQWHLLDGTPLTVIRPLLDADREETESYCAACGLAPRSDSSNISKEYLRNRIRSELMPRLLEYNPKMPRALCRTADLIADDIAYFDEVVIQLWDVVVEKSPSGIVLDNQAFSDLPPALRRHLLRAMIGQLRGSLRDIGQRHIESLMMMMLRPAGKKLSLPYGLRFYGDYTKSYLSSSEVHELSLTPLEGEYQMTIPGVTCFSDWRVKAEVVDASLEMTDCSNYVAYFDFDLTGASLAVRNRRDGDRFRPLGMNGSKKLQDFMVDAKIPRALRDRIPLVCSEGQIIWVVGWRIDQRVRVTDATEHVLRIEFLKT